MPMDKKTMRSVLTQLCQRPVAYYPAYAELTGSVKAGILLSQIMYWWSAVGGKKFYKTDEELRHETALTPKEYKTAKAAVKALVFVEVTLEKSPALTHYDIDYEVFIASLAERDKLDGPKGTNKMVQKGPTSLAERDQLSITENTTENTQRVSESATPLANKKIDVKKFFAEGERWVDGDGDASGALLREVARWMVVDKKWDKKKSSAELKSFILYWSETNTTGTKQAWQKKPTFDVKRRLVTWMNNNK